MLLALEKLVFKQRARRDDARDLAFDDALGLARVLDLLADRRAVALLHELPQVPIEGVMRNAAHRDALVAGVLAARQCEPKGLGADARILVEHLVEVTHAEH